MLGPTVWKWAGRGAVVDATAGLRAGGMLLLLASVVVVVRDPHRAWQVRRSWRGVLLAAAAGGLLVVMQQLPGAMAAPAGLAALLVVLGQELWFRGVLLERIGAWRAVVIWVVIVGAAAPIQAAISGALLSYLSRCYGLFAAILAALFWRLLG